MLSTLWLLELLGTRWSLWAACTFNAAVALAAAAMAEGRAARPDPDPPEVRVQPPTRGKIIALPRVGGLHHRYVRAE
jgi:hypothetical protein